MKYKSVFDIIGPVMVGPSSSHTAGAARIGRAARNILGSEPTWVKIHYYESFAQTHKGHGTDLALIGGLLGMDSDDDNLVNSEKIALEKGINIQIIEEDGAAPHPNTAKVILGNSENGVEVVGTSIGGGMIEIVMINGFELKMKGDTTAIMITNKDKPGAVAKVTHILNEHNINIGFMDVARKEKGRNALMTIQVDDCVSDGLLSELRGLDCVLNAIKFE